MTILRRLRDRAAESRRQAETCAYDPSIGESTRKAVRDVDALEAAAVVRGKLLRRYSERCEDVASGLAWYEENVEVWNPEKLQWYYGTAPAARASAAVFLEGRPFDSEVGPEDWPAEISMDPDILARIPGWYMEVESGAIVTFWPI